MSLGCRHITSTSLQCVSGVGAEMMTEAEEVGVARSEVRPQAWRWMCGGGGVGGGGVGGVIGALGIHATESCPTAGTCNVSRPGEHGDLVLCAWNGPIRSELVRLLDGSHL